MPKAQRIDATSAEDKSIGFDYQYYYFLNELINLKTGMKVGLEVMDDVHTELDNDTQVLVQLKHTVQKTARGEPKNLTTMDVDLWKTLSNWAKVIADPAAGRNDRSSQLAFTNRTRFLLASNKSDNEGNLLLKSVRAYQEDELEYFELRDKIFEIRNESKNEDVVGYINDVLGLNGVPGLHVEAAKVFIEHLSFDLGCDGIITKCKTSIREKQIDDNRVDDVFRALDSDVRAENFDFVKAKKKIVFSFEDFRNLCRPHFDKARNGKLVVRQFTGLLPENMNEQVFIQQLLDIKDFKPDDLQEITRLTIQLLRARNNANRWVKDADITTTELEELENELISSWRNKFKVAHRNNNTAKDALDAALGIVDGLREKTLNIQDQDLGTDISDGVLYDLSDRPEIGWLIDWEEKYK
jgi:hypothetical protein